MLKKYFTFFISINILLLVLSTKVVFANPSISSLLLNGSAQNVSFNPNNSENVSIEVKSNTPVKFTRLYICSVDQTCNGTSGNYTRYFTQTDISDTIVKTWNGKKSGDTEIVPEGEYKVMVSMTEGTNSPITEFGQYSIFVNFSSTSTTINSTSSYLSNNASVTNTSSNTQIIPTTIRTVYVSTHSDPEDLSIYDEKKPFEITAGRERMALIGSPLEFKAKYSLLHKDQCVPFFKWTFGDGFEASGKSTEHIYKYKGEYQVVLNGICGEFNSISRTIVKVVSPNISILNIENGEVEIVNNGKVEVNIGKWKIIPTYKVGTPTGASEKKDFILPDDTIIGASQKITLSKEDLEYTTSTIDKISLNNLLDREVAALYLSKLFQDATTSENISVAEAEILLEEYKKSLAFKNLKLVEKKIQVEDENVDNINQTATVVESINISTSTPKGLLSKLIDIPIRSIKSILNIFYDF